MMFGAVGNPDHDDCGRIVHRALDAGINFIDTADMYSAGESEEVVGKAIKGRRDDVVLATKCFFPLGEERNGRGGSRRYIVRAVEDSLRRLGTDRIDLYQMHRRDWDTDLDETLDALSDLVRQGKILYAGSSSFPADQIVEAQWAAERRGGVRFVCEQPQYRSSPGRSRSPCCPPRRHGMGVIPWSRSRRLADRQVPAGRAGAGRVPVRAVDRPAGVAAQRRVRPERTRPVRRRRAAHEDR